MRKNIFNLKYPFLYQRKLSIFLVCIDYFIFKIFLNSFAYLQYPVINSYLFCLIWVIFNYIFSQYMIIKIFNFKNIIKKFFTSQLANFCVHFLYFLLALLSFFEFFNIDKIMEIFISSISISFICCFYRVLIMYMTRLKNRKYKIFGYWGSEEDLKEINNLYLNNINYKFKLILINYDNFNSIFNKVHKIITPTNFQFNKNLVKNLPPNSFKIEDKFLDLTNWSEYILQRLPTVIIKNDKNILSNLRLIKYKLSYKIKNLVEFIISLFLLILFIPIIILFGFLIKIEDGGPVFYSQKRSGLNGKIFYVYKLRSMKINSEKNKAVWSYIGDTRVTKIGKFLRKSRIDEIPQLLCVLKGEMSLIGPRPERPEFDEMLSKKIKNYNMRNLIKPGISGWSQVSYPYGASVNDAEIKLSFDIYYIRNFSLLFDFLIFFKTIRLVLRLENSQPLMKS